MKKFENSLGGEFVNSKVGSCAVLALADGTVFNGRAIGASGISVGEVVFNTAMTGYQEILTDPSYDGQIITFTYPHIGNTGINFEDNESKNIAARGLVVKNFCDFPSNYRSKMSLEDFLIEQKTICISDIDTRHLTKILRDEGCKIGAIYPSKLFTDEEAISGIKQFGTMNGKNFTENVAVLKPYAYGAPKTPKKLKIVAVDFGIKENILRIMKSMGGDITVVPPSTSAKDIKALNPITILSSQYFTFLRTPGNIAGAVAERSPGVNRILRRTQKIHHLTIYHSRYFTFGIDPHK